MPAMPPAIDTFPRVMAPRLNVTDPVGALRLEEDTVAAKVTLCPYVEGLLLDVIETVEL